MSLQLQELIDVLPRAAVTGAGAIEVCGLRDDSRAVQAGDVFVALRGAAIDGHDHTAAAIASGAGAIVAEEPRPAGVPEEVAWVLVPDTREALAAMADLWFGRPSREMKVAGVTGTNGKTTTSFLLHSIMKRTLHRAGLIGTVLFDDGEEVAEATHTTPGALELQELLDRTRISSVVRSPMA